MSMILVFHPEEEQALAARVADAIKEVCDGSWAPGMYRRHVFDFQDGTRLIVSRDHIDDFRGIHVSAGVDTKFSLWKRLVRIKGGDARVNAFCQHAERLIREVLKIDGMKYAGIFTDKGIPHWHKPDVDTGD